MKKKKDLLEKINPLIMLFDSLLFVSIGITSLISFYDNENIIAFDH